MKPLETDRLCARCDPGQFCFETTATLAEPDEAFGQARAVDALRLAVDVPGPGYNLFVLGRPGSGRHDVVRRLLEAHAATRPTPPDLCYVTNFNDPNKPSSLTLPPGQGAQLHAAMQGFIAELSKAITAAFESDEYRLRIAAIETQYKQREESALQALGADAAREGVALLRTPQGFVFTPMKGSEPMPPGEFESLPQDERERIGKVVQQLHERLQQLTNELPRQRREMHERIREASRDAMALAAGHLIDELKERFVGHANVQDYLSCVLKDVIAAGEQLREQPQDESEAMIGLTGNLSLARYRVNVLVGHEANARAPVVTEDSPSYANLVGRIDHVAHLGTLLTNFTLIKPGALHRASGGYLMLDAVKVLTQPYAWDGLKRALKCGFIRIESLAQMSGWVSTLPLEPQPMAHSSKIVLFGERMHYYLLQQLDPEFDELFKVAADFEDDVPRDAGNIGRFAGLVGSMARSQGVRPLDRGAVARLVEYSSRASGRADRLSTHTRSLNDLLCEADHQARAATRNCISEHDVVLALAAKVRRADRLRDRMHDEVLNDTVLISTSGEHVGQVNGLAVIDLGDFAFGQPMRITATARVGDGDLVDIERESTLGQPIHSKGVMILASFLGARYAQGQPLSLSASLVFEQSYGAVEGDSASLAELCALLSALALVPIRQAFAVTGSVNQYGRVQAVGAINEKIEGFFDICNARGLTGEQAVLVPAENVKHLMLRDDVVAASSQGLFHIYPVRDVDEAIALLTGVPAGVPDEKGVVPDATINHRVLGRLARMSRVRQDYAAGLVRRRGRPRRVLRDDADSEY